MPATLENANQDIKEMHVGEIRCISLQGEFTAKGAECQYFAMGEQDRYGIKSFYTWLSALEAYKRQERAYKHGLAPNVGSMLIIHNPNSSIVRFGYETEKAHPVFANSPVYLSEKENLKAKLIEIKSGGYDLSPENCGIYRGNLVSVDFGSCSSPTSEI